MHAIEELLDRAREARAQHRLPDAKRALRDAVARLRPLGSVPALANALRELGETERRLGEPEAVVHYEEAVALFQALGEHHSLAHAIRHLGDLHHDAGRFALAMPLYRDALRIYRNAPGARPLDLANALRSLGVAEEEDGRPEDAIRLWQEARAIYAAEGVDAGVEESDARLGGLGAR